MGLAEGRGTTDTGQCASDQDDWVAHLVILALCSALPAEHGSGCSDSELEDRSPVCYAPEKIRYWRTKLSPIKRARGQRIHIWSAPHRRPSKSRTCGITAYDRAAQLAFPWAPEDYPGLLRGMANLLGEKAAVRTIIDWRRARYKPPLWAIEVLQDALRQRANRELAAVEELEKEKAARSTAL
jgi:hypothetical protein